ncbi:polyketide synthase dehydratase domain-containing protein [Nonomuraea antimicrobica]
MDHALLGAAVDLSDQGGVVLTGRLSASAHPWLADHAVGGRVLFPGTGFVELAVRAGDEVGCSAVEELTIEAPLTVEVGEPVVIQVTVGAQGEDGRRALSVHSRTESRPWTRHAAGTLAAGDEGAAFELKQWPPVGAQPVEVSEYYEALAAQGYEYGPSFRGMKRAWMADGEVFAEVELGEREASEAGRYGIHPVLLDAALHAIGVADGLADGGTGDKRPVSLPFAWTDVRLHASAASHLRVRLRFGDGREVAVDAADAAGRPVVAVGSLVLREVAEQQPAPAASASSLLRLDWTPLQAEAPGPVQRVAVVGERSTDLDAALASVVEHVSYHADVDAVVGAGENVPEAVIMRIEAARAIGDERSMPEELRSSLSGLTDLLGRWLGEERLAGARLVLVTRGAVAALGTDGAPDLAGAAVCGLVRSAQAEHPGRILLVDVDETPQSSQTLAAVLGIDDEPQLAVREGTVLMPRLAKAAASTDLRLPEQASAGLRTPGDAGAWRLDSPAKGSLDALALLPAPEADRELSAGQVRVSVRAAGLNFRDVLNALGMYPGEAGAMGVEFAGVVTELGSGVEGLRVGDRVLGLGEGTFGPRVVVDRRMVVVMPDGWDFAGAASVPGVFATAWYGLVDLAGLRSGERVLIHAGAGGVGMAAIQIARHLGAEVFATASPAKQHLLRGLGIAEDHIASSRTLDFARTFAGHGMDVVLNSLAGEFTDASSTSSPTVAGSSRWARPICVTPNSSPPPTREWSTATSI